MVNFSPILDIVSYMRTNPHIISRDRGIILLHRSTGTPRPVPLGGSSAPSRLFPRDVPRDVYTMCVCVCVCGFSRFGFFSGFF